MLKYLRGSLILGGLGLALGGLTGWFTHGTWAAVLSTTFIVLVLTVLEISLSFDNAVVNATVLRDMTPLWRRRFMTWGILTAVLGMRIVLPLAAVAVIGRLSPLDAVILAGTNPEEYARILSSAHHAVSAFGGAFLGMVGFKYFFDHEKDVHWIAVVESRLSKLGRIRSVEMAVVIGLLYVVSKQVDVDHQLEFLVAGLFGLVTHVAVAGLGELLESGEEAGGAIVRSGLSSFLYLEVLDASFSFDGVIGAFALSKNLIVIGLGLGVGAMFVRSLTIMLVEQQTLAEYVYLEHGAFYAIIALGMIMFLQAFVPIPEVVTGLIGATAIGLAFYSSVRHNRRQAHSAAADVETAG
jgi:hypothetical protein